MFHDEIINIPGDSKKRQGLYFKRRICLMSFFRLMLMTTGTIVWKPHQRKKKSVKTSYSQGQGEANLEAAENLYKQKYLSTGMQCKWSTQ